MPKRSLFFQTFSDEKDKQKKTTTKTTTQTYLIYLVHVSGSIYFYTITFIFRNQLSLDLKSVLF